MLGSFGETVPEGVSSLLPGPREPTLSSPEPSVSTTNEALSEPFTGLLTSLFSVVAHLLAGLAEGLLRTSQSWVHRPVVDGQDCVEFADGERHEGHLLGVRGFFSGGGAKCLCRRDSVERRPKTRAWNQRQVRRLRTPPPTSTP